MTATKTILEGLKSVRGELHKPLVIQAWAAWATVVFAIYGLLASTPCFCQAGTTISRCISVLFVIVLGRLLLGVIRGNLKWQDYALWVGAFLLFAHLSPELLT